MQTLYPIALPTPIYPQYSQGHPLTGTQLPIPPFSSQGLLLPSFLGTCRQYPQLPLLLFPRLTALLLHTLSHPPSHLPLDMV